MTAPALDEMWGVTDSARLTAVFIVLDGKHMPAEGLDEHEIRACVELAHEHKIRRAVVAERIGWRNDRLWQWCRKRGIAYREDGYPDEPLAWCSKRFNEAHTEPGRFKRARGQGR